MFIDHLGIIFDEGPSKYFPPFFSIYIVYIFLIDFEKLFILYECFLLVTDIVIISLEGMFFPLSFFFFGNNMEK